MTGSSGHPGDVDRNGRGTGSTDRDEVGIDFQREVGDSRFRGHRVPVADVELHIGGGTGDVCDQATDSPRDWTLETSNAL